MLQSILPLLSCPARSVPARPCGGTLLVQDSPALPLRFDPALRDDLLEGLLRCVSCGKDYPVLSGVAVLHPDPDDYLRRYGRAVLRDLDRHGSAPPEVRRWLVRRTGREAEQDDYGADFRYSQQFEGPYAVAGAMLEQPEALYGPYAEWLRQIEGQGPYDVLAGWGREAARRGFLLDAGCGGGGLLVRAAEAYQAAFGVDLSFLAILLARRALLHRPEAERSYLLVTRRGEERERPLSVPRLRNTELVVGDAAAVPFAPGLFDTVCSCNVIDIAGIEGPLSEAARVLGKGGSLLLSDPFFFRDGEAPPRDPKEALHRALRARGLQIQRERDAVPWAWATYDRHWHVYFNYCVAAVKE
ncbi:MAG: class I SAM-dependent methyltransferase [Armatimonadota bacterium]